MNYNIKLDSFKGPLDLLLNLIEKAEIDIYDIPINLITKQYMEYIYEMEHLNIEIASEFIVMAATLLQIKSKMLLPQDINIDGDEDIIDPREELVLQLTAYKKYKEAAKNLRRYEEYELKAYYKPKEDLDIFELEEVELESMDLNLIVETINKIISNRGLETEVHVHKIIREKYSVDECSNNIIDILDSKKNIKFTNLFSDNTSISEVITYFLSILELIKLQLISVKQNHNFTDLIITKEE